MRLVQIERWVPPPSVDSVMWLSPQQTATFRKSPGKCFRYQQTNKGWSVICWSASATRCSAPPGRTLLEQVRRRRCGRGGLWWMSLSAYCGPTMTVCSSRTLDGMIWAMLLPDLTYWHWGAHLSQAGLGVSSWWSYYKRVSLLILSPALAISASKRLFVICNVMFRPHRERGSAEIKQPSSRCFTWNFYFAHVLLLHKVPLATSDLSLMCN